jgi:hypothetical protein
MSDDSINTLIGTFSSVPQSIGTETMDQCICIDTSTNRIGINTLTPQYAIDISNLSSTNPQSIRTPRLIVNDKIGINTLTPEYAIDISNLSSSDPQYIRTPRLIISDIRRLPFANTIPDILYLTSGEIYVDASNYLRFR